VTGEGPADVEAPLDVGVAVGGGTLAVVEAAGIKSASAFWQETTEQIHTHASKTLALISRVRNTVAPDFSSRGFIYCNRAMAIRRFADGAPPPEARS